MVRQLGPKLASGAGQQHLLSRRQTNIVVSVLSLVTIVFFQEILGWGAYLPLPGFDKKGRMVLFCQMEVLFLLIIMSNGGVVLSFYRCRSSN